MKAQRHEYIFTNIDKGWRKQARLFQLSLFQWAINDDTTSMLASRLAALGKSVPQICFGKVD